MYIAIGEYLIGLQKRLAMFLYLNRRTFLKQVGLLSAGVLSGTHHLFSRTHFYDEDRIDDFIKERMALYHIPGLAASVILGDEIVWSKGYGYADLEQKILMNPTETIQNIGSISKTIVATAAMQLWEQKKMELDKDVNEYLPFPVRNPNHPEEPITPHQLLTHRSSIKDEPAYGMSYACGDPKEKLGDWLSNYFSPGGNHYDAEENFHSWQPGTEEQLPFQPRNYTNVGFGLLAFLVERISEMPFYVYCQANIFDPLEMDNSGWFIKDIDASQHAIPYDFLTADFQLPPGLTYEQLLPQKSQVETPLKPETYFPHCLYSFPNYPDGLLRTSATELSHFLIAYLNGGLFKKQRILQSTTIDQMLQVQLAVDPMQGFCWQHIQVGENDFVWGHGGGDPGINTFVMMDPKSKKGAIVLTNGSQGNTFELTHELL